jgi:hypothetical protein
VEGDDIGCSCTAERVLFTSLGIGGDRVEDSIGGIGTLELLVEEEEEEEAETTGPA